MILGDGDPSGAAVAYAPGSRPARVERRLWYRILALRCAMFAVSAVISVVAAEHLGFQESNWLAATAGGAGQLVLHYVVLRRRGYTPPWMFVLDHVAILAGVVIVPDQLPVCALLLLMFTAASVAIYGRRVGVISLVIVAPVMAAVTFSSDSVHDRLTFTWWLIASVFTTFAVGAVHERQAGVQERRDDLLDGLGAVVWEADRVDATPYYVSDGITRWLGYAREDFYRPGFWASLLHPDDLWVEDHTLHLRRSGRDHTIEYRLRTADDRWVEVQELVTVEGGTTAEQPPTTGPNRGWRTVRGVMLDVTAQRQAEERTRLYADVVEKTPVPTLIVRPQGPDGTAELVTANPPGAELLGRVAEDLAGRRLTDVAPWECRIGLVSQLKEIADGRSAEFGEVRLEVAGRERLCRVTATPLSGGLVGITVEDVTERHRAANALRRRTLHDHLTGLPNRVHLQNRIDEAIAAAGPDSAISLIVIDIDQFKDVNDALGHHQGDRLLAELGRRLAHTLAGSATTVARLGADEFAVLVTERDVAPHGTAHGTPPPLAGQASQRVTEALADPVQVDDLSLQVGASMGIASFPSQATDTGSLLRMADIALHSAKRDGGSVVVYSQDQDGSSVRRMSLLSRLRSAVQDDELRVEYQPVVDLQTGEVVGMEALVRWEHPQLGRLLPDEFIGLAEVSGLIRPLTHFVTEAATREVSSLLGHGFELSVAVNLSPRSLHDPRLGTWIKELLDATDIPPRLLRLEITENELMEDPQRAMEVLAQLRASGIESSIDDFGTGYSSLSYLRDLPITEIKIDRTFVEDLAEGDSAIVESVIELGHNLGLRVVAEGVESAATLARLTELGCDRAQGFLISRPVGVDALLAFLEDRSPGRPWALPYAGGTGFAGSA